MDQSYGYNTPPPATNSTMAIVSLVAGIVGWTIVPIIGSIVAIITGHMAKNEIKNSGGRLTGDGLATAGLILGYAAVGLTVCGICIFVAIFGLSMLGVASTEWNALLPLVF